MLTKTLAAALLALAALTACSGGSDDAAPTADPSASPSAGAFDQALEAQQTGDLDRAQELFEAVLEEEPDNLLAHYNLGLVHQTRGDTEAALAAYDEARRIDPDYVPALFNSAVLYAEDNPGLAIETYRRIVVLQPQAPTAFLNLGLLEIAQGDLEQGAADLETALRQDPSLVDRLSPDQRAAVEQRVAATATPTP